MNRRAGGKRSPAPENHRRDRPGCLENPISIQRKLLTFNRESTGLSLCWGRNPARRFACAGLLSIRPSGAEAYARSSFPPKRGETRQNAQRVKMLRMTSLWCGRFGFYRSRSQAGRPSKTKRASRCQLALLLMIHSTVIPAPLYWRGPREASVAPQAPRATRSGCRTAGAAGSTPLRPAARSAGRRRGG